MLVDEWSRLFDDLARENGPHWDMERQYRGANLLGMDKEVGKQSRFGVLSRAAWGLFDGLADEEGGGRTGTPGRPGLGPNCST